MVNEKKEKFIMKKVLLSSILFFSFTLLGFAQTSTETTIDSKFSELINSSNNFKGFKVVDARDLATLQSQTSARIQELKEEIAVAKEAAVIQKEKVAALKADMESLEAQLKEVTAEKDAITFLGMPFSKEGYKTLMGGVIGALLVALLLFIYRFRKGNVQTQEARQNLAEMEKEFDAYRAKSLEKEQKLGRQLQDERNKHMKVAK